jgi:Gas vesicle synthesis protein GvpL/GvpF
VNEELARLAREAAPEVLAAALDRAREQAVARLADLLADAIVTEALRGPVEAPPPEERPPEERPPEDQRPERPPEPADISEALYAYGITSADGPLPEGVPGLNPDAPIERVTVGDLGLLVNRVTTDQLQVDADDLSETGRLATLARSHDAVVRAAAAAAPVLPFRFGTVVPDKTAACRLLAEHGDTARAQLRRIGTSREWGIKIVRRSAEPDPADSRTVDRVGVSGTEYLARRRRSLEERESAERTAERTAQQVEEALRPHVTESVRRGGSPGSPLLLDLAVLVPPNREAAFAAATAELRERLASDRLELEVSGPWPAYSFAALELGDA